MRLRAVVAAFLFCAGLNIHAFGVKEPVIDGAIAVSSREIRVDLDWSKSGAAGKNALKAADYSFALFRARVPFNSVVSDNVAGRKTPPRVFTFVREIRPPEQPVFYGYGTQAKAPPVSMKTSEFDTAAEPGYVYTYQVFFVKGIFKTASSVANSAAAGGGVMPIQENNIDKTIKPRKVSGASIVLAEPPMLKVLFNRAANSVEISALFNEDAAFNTEAAAEAAQQLSVTPPKSAVRSESKLRYWLYKADSVQPGSFKFLREISRLENPVIDAAVVPGSNYSYAIHYTVEDDRLAGENKPPPEISAQSLRQFQSVYVPPHQLPPSLAEQQLPIPKSNAQGIFTGIVSFSNDAFYVSESALGAKTTGALVPLDTLTRTEALIEQFNSRYELSSSSGTALYYAFHKALANIGEHLSARQGVRTIPDIIDSIFVITITDGQDNSSANILLPDIDGGVRFLIPHSDRLSGKYPSYIESWLSAGNFDNIPVYSYTFGITGAGLSSAAELQSLSRGKKPFLGSIEDLKSELRNVIPEMNIGRQSTQVTVGLPSFYNGDKVKIIIDESHYIDAALEFDEINEAVYLTNIRTEPENLLREKGKLRGTPGDGVFAYKFTLNMPPPANKNGMVEVRAANGVQRIDTEAFVNIYSDSQVERKTSIIYFVLDSSKSLGTEISTIKREVSSIIKELFEINIGYLTPAAAQPVNVNKSSPPAASASSQAAAGPLPPVAPKYLTLNAFKEQIDALPAGFFRQHGIIENEFWTRAGFSDTAAYNETDLVKRAAYSLGYWVQLRSFREAGAKEASRSADTLRVSLPSVHLAHIISDTDQYTYKLWIGPFADKATADSAKNLLRYLK